MALSLRHVKRKEMLLYISGSKRIKCVILRDGIDVKGNRIMANEWRMISLLRKTRKSELPKLKLCNSDHHNNGCHLLNPCCAQYFMLIITLRSAGEDVTVRDKTAVWKRERSDWLTSFLSSYAKCPKAFSQVHKTKWWENR